jgi:hypothetical protein
VRAITLERGWAAVPPRRVSKVITARVMDAEPA